MASGNAACPLFTFPACSCLPEFAMSQHPPPSRHAIRLTINGTPHRLEVESWTSLLDLLRDQLHLTGTKKGCDHGQCGACTVLIGDVRVLSCLTLAAMHDGDEVTTV